MVFGQYKLLLKVKEGGQKFRKFFFSVKSELRLSLPVELKKIDESHALIRLSKH